MPLIKQIHDAVQNSELKQPFTTEDLKFWMRANKIVKDDGEEYAESSINSILSNSDTKNIPTTNKNCKTLKSKLNDCGKREFSF